MVFLFYFAIVRKLQTKTLFISLIIDSKKIFCKEKGECWIRPFAQT